MLTFHGRSLSTNFNFWCILLVLFLTVVSLVQLIHICLCVISRVLQETAHWKKPLSNSGILTRTFSLICTVPFKLLKCSLQKKSSRPAVKPAAFLLCGNGDNHSTCWYYSNTKTVFNPSNIKYLFNGNVTVFFFLLFFVLFPNNSAGLFAFCQSSSSCVSL